MQEDSVDATFLMGLILIAYIGLLHFITLWHIDQVASDIIQSINAVPHSANVSCEIREGMT